MLSKGPFCRRQLLSPQGLSSFLKNLRFFFKKMQKCALPFCSASTTENERYCCGDHKLLAKKCWMNTCTAFRFVHTNGKKAKGCCRTHSFLLKRILANELNCDGSKPGCEECHPYDLRDVAHSNLITGEECYCYKCCSVCEKVESV